MCLRNCTIPATSTDVRMTTEPSRLPVKVLTIYASLSHSRDHSGPHSTPLLDSPATELRHTAFDVELAQPLLPAPPLPHPTRTTLSQMMDTRLSFDSTALPRYHSVVGIPGMRGGHAGLVSATSVADDRHSSPRIPHQPWAVAQAISHFSWLVSPLHLLSTPHARTRNPLNPSPLSGIQNQDLAMSASATNKMQYGVCLAGRSDGSPPRQVGPQGLPPHPVRAMRESR